MPAQSSKRDRTQVNPAFTQSSLAALERIALFLYRWLAPETQDQLQATLSAVRRELRLPLPRHFLLSWRDWPRDDAAGDALGSLLRRLGELERSATEWRQTSRGNT